MKFNNHRKIVYNEEKKVEIRCWDQFQPTGTKHLSIFKNLCYNKN